MKREYRWHYYGVKYLPALCTALFTIAAILLVMYPEKREWLITHVNILNSLSFVAGVLLIVASYAMKFCWIHRMHIIYLMIATYFISKPGSELLLASSGIILLLFTLYVIFIRRHCEKINPNDAAEETS